MKLNAPQYISAIKWLLLFMVVYLAGLFLFARITHTHYGKWTYTLYWIPAYLINAWIVLFINWLQRDFELPKKLYLLLVICYVMFLAIGLGYDWVMIFAGTWYFGSHSVVGIDVIKGYDIFGNPASVPLEEFIFDLTFLPFGCLVVAAAFFKFFSITLVFQKKALHFKVLMKYQGFQLPTLLRLLQVDDLDEFIAAYDPRDEANYRHLIRKEVVIVEGVPIARLFPFIRF